MRLSIVIPCYNEVSVIPLTHDRIKQNLLKLVQKNKISDYEMIYVDDGSSDGTLNLLHEIADQDQHLSIIELSRNYGHQNALLAGLHHAQGDIIASMDADLEDPPEMLEKMIDEISSGYDIVYGVRSNREKDTFFKRITAKAFYRLMKLLGTEVIPDHAEFRMFTQQVQESLKQFHESNIFLRGIFPIMGYRSTSVYYFRDLRVAGETKYGFFKMVAFAMNGIISHSRIPLLVPFVFGIFFLALSLILLTVYIFQLLLSDFVSERIFDIVLLSGFAGIQLLTIAVIAEYIGRIYIESKARPHYIVRSIHGSSANKKNIIKPHTQTFRSTPVRDAISDS